MSKITFRFTLLLLLLLSVCFLYYIKSAVNNSINEAGTISLNTPINHDLKVATNTHEVKPPVSTNPIIHKLASTTTSEATKPSSSTSTSTHLTSTTTVLMKPTFSGQLEQVNTGCFSDGECFIVVDGKHVTILRGWSRDTVGTVIGEDGIGGLEAHIGSTVDVYASSTGNNSYTLYGNANYYVKLQTLVVSQVEAGCMIGGCSAELCVNEGSGGAVSSCIYREQYACYKTAHCAKQTTGQCGWTQTADLKMCISTKS